MADSDIPAWAADIRDRVTRIEQMMLNHLEQHKTHQNGDLRRMVALGLGIGAGFAGVGAGVVKALGF